jgi:methylase of polypeptide subunit release factors
VMEIGYGQRRGVSRIMESGRFQVAEVRKDHNGIDRVIAGRWIN